jgi:hypothetical protein
LETRESVSVDFPWSTWAITDILRMFLFLSIMTRISSTVKFTWKQSHKYACNLLHCSSVSSGDDADLTYGNIKYTVILYLVVMMQTWHMVI